MSPESNVLAERSKKALRIQIVRLFFKNSTESAQKEMDRLAGCVKEQGCDLVIGVGGGTIRHGKSCGLLHRDTSDHLSDNRRYRCSMFRADGCLYRGRRV